ncbi:hypothetical protein [Pseudoneobacillus sp. C159]
MPKYKDLEAKIIQVIRRDGEFRFGNRVWRVIEVDSPRPSSGECKTDVYVLAESNGESKEFKISVKTRTTNEFQENKIKSERAESIFGIHYQDIIERAARSIEDRFYSQPLVFAVKSRRTDPNSITMGWKLEITSKPRPLGVRVPLSDEEIREFVYKGSNLPSRLKDAYVNGRIVRNSGVAEYMVYLDLYDFQTANEVMNHIQDIDTAKFPDMYIAFTANNFCTNKEVRESSARSTDNKRDLAVRVEYFLHNGKLDRHIHFDHPLELTGFDVKLQTLPILRQLGKIHPSSMRPTDFHEPSLFFNV